MKQNNILLLLVLLVTLPISGQTVAIKTNLLYLATTTPNIGLECQLSKHCTASLTCGYNPFRFAEHEDAQGNKVNPKIHHWLASGEVRYWFCESFLGWNVGVNVFGGDYNVGGLKFINSLKDNRYKGWGTGAGMTVGYQFPLSVRWSLDLSAGIGYVHTRYNKYECYVCGDKEGNFKRNYWGPTKAAVSFVYFLK